MSLSRRLRHRVSRGHLLRQAFYTYVFAFALMFLKLHFVGSTHSHPVFDRERLPANDAARQAFLWALIGPVMWVIDEYVLRGSDLWISYSNLDSEIQRLVWAGGVAIVGATVIAWRWMLPLWGLAATVALYLRFSRSKDSL